MVSEEGLERAGLEVQETVQVDGEGPMWPHVEIQSP